jgi:DNA-binding transcriptional LysR family regulator
MSGGKRFDFDLTTLRLFEAAVRLGSISAAAEEQNIAISAVSRRLSDMEYRLGTALLYREVRGVDVTPAGAAMLGHARGLLRLASRASEDMKDYIDGSQGVIRVAANPSAVSQFLPDVFQSFRAENPSVRFELKEMISDAIVRDIRDSHVDIGIFAGMVPHSEIETFPFSEDRLCAVVAKTHPLASKDVSFAELAAYPYIALEDGSSLSVQLERLAEEMGATLNVAVRVRSFDSVRQLASRDIGFGVLPRAVAAPYAKSDGLCLIEFDEPWAKRSFLIGVRERAALSKSSERFLMHMLNQVKN